MKTERDSVTKQEEVHNIVARAGPKSHLLSYVLLEVTDTWTKILHLFKLNLRKLKYFAFWYLILCWMLSEQ